MRRIILPVVLLSVFGALGWLATSRAGAAGLASSSSSSTLSSGASSVSQAGGARPWLAFREGEAWRLDVDYRATTAATPLGADSAGASIAGEAALAGAVDLIAADVDGDRARLVLTVARCDAARVRVLDRDLLAGVPDCKAALAGELVVEVSARGALSGVAQLPAGAAPTLGTRVLEALALELFTPLPAHADAAETARDTTPRGAHDVSVLARAVDGGFDVDGRAEGPLVEARLPLGDASDAARVRARTALALRAGRPSSVHVSENVEGGGVRAEVTLTATLADVRAATAQPALATLALAPAFSTHEAAQERALASQRIAGLTAPEVMSALSVVNAGGTPGDHSRFLWRATALVKEDPALAQMLADAAMRDDVTTKGRAHALDLLAQAGSVEAERALVAALQSDAARKDPHHPVHVQRLSLLEHPTSVAADAVLGALAREEKVGVRGAYLASAGAIAAAIDDDAARARLHQAIEDGLKKDGEELQAALLGVGNSRSPSLAARAETYLLSESASVRASAITAVTDGRHPRLAALLVEAAQDRASLVQRAALRALDHGFARESIDAVARAVETDALRRDNARVAIDVLKHHGHEDAARTQAALEVLMQDERLAGEERAAARSLSAALVRGPWGG